MGALNNLSGARPRRAARRRSLHPSRSSIGMEFWASTNNPLPSGPIPPSRCSTTSSSTLYILLGDSIDRELVRSRCAAPVAYNDGHCAKCVLCAANPCETWLNVMLFGLGLYSCEHKDKNWAPQEESQSIQPRVEALLAAVLHSPRPALSE